MPTVYSSSRPSSPNGIPGTHTHTIALDGIAQPITYTITNLTRTTAIPPSFPPSRSSAHRRATPRSH